MSTKATVSRASLTKAIEQSQAVRSYKRKLGMAIRDRWRDASSGVMLPGMTAPVDSDRLSGALGQLVITGDSVRIPITTLPARQYLGLLEAGHGPIDLKPGLLSGPSVKISKTGEPYAVVPLGFDTDGGSGPSTIPQRYQSKLAPVEDNAPQPQFQPQNAAERRPFGVSPRKQMNWGRRRTISGYRQRYGHLSGLRGNASFGYRTFRAVTALSPATSWIVPAVGPNPIRQAVIDAALRSVR